MNKDNPSLEPVEVRFNPRQLEQVARAICEADFSNPWPTDGYNDRQQKRHYYRLARAAIEAITAWNTRPEAQSLPTVSEADGLVEALASEIEGYFSEATNNACTCNIDENACRYCSAWTQASRKTESAIRAALNPEGSDHEG